MRRSSGWYQPKDCTGSPLPGLDEDGTGVLTSYGLPSPWNSTGAAPRGWRQRTHPRLPERAEGDRPAQAGSRARTLQSRLYRRRPVAAAGAAAGAAADPLAVVREAHCRRRVDDDRSARRRTSREAADEGGGVRSRHRRQRSADHRRQWSAEMPTTEPFNPEALRHAAGPVPAAISRDVAVAVAVASAVPPYPP